MNHLILGHMLRQTQFLMVSFETWMISSILVVPPLVSGQSSTQMKQKESESATENTKIQQASPAMSSPKQTFFLTLDKPQ